MFPTRQIKTTAALALALVALTPAAASASHPVDPGSATPTPPYQNSVVRVITPTLGFDWEDAGIGAAAGLALSMLALGGTLAISQRRTRHPNADQLTNQPPPPRNTDTVSTPEDNPPVPQRPRTDSAPHLPR